MRFPGIIPAITTPFTEADTIDFPALQAQLALQHRVPRQLADPGDDHAGRHALGVRIDGFVAGGGGHASIGS